MFGFRKLQSLFHHTDNSGYTPEKVTTIAEMVNALLPESPVIESGCDDDSIGDWDVVTYAGYTSGILNLKLESYDVVLHAWDEETMEFHSITLPLRVKSLIHVEWRGC